MGHKVTAIGGHPEATETARKMAKDLIKKWRDEVTGNVTSSAIEVEARHRENVGRARKLSIKEKTAAERAAADELSAARRHPEMFAPPTRTFKVIPESSMRPDKKTKKDKDAPKSRRERILAATKQMMAKAKTP